MNSNIIDFDNLDEQSADVEQAHPFKAFKTPKSLSVQMTTANTSKVLTTQKASWLNDLKDSHKKFNFSKATPQLVKSESAIKREELFKVEMLYKDERNPIHMLIKRIVYAEGDFIEQNVECISYLKH